MVVNVYSSTSSIGWKSWPFKKQVKLATELYSRPEGGSLKKMIETWALLEDVVQLCRNLTDAICRYGKSDLSVILKTIPTDFG